MANELAMIGNDFKEITQIGNAMAQSGYFSDAGKGAQAIVKILAGREMGFGPFASMNGINIIKGKPAIGANLMASAVRAHPHYDYQVKTLTEKLCVLVFYRDGKAIDESSFSIDEAKKAGVGGMRPPGKPGTMLEMHPKNMLFSRAMSNGVRWFCPDVFSGNAVYTPDEIYDGFAEPPVIIEKRVLDEEAILDPAPDFDADADAAMVDALVEEAAEEARPVWNSKQMAIAWAIAQGAFGEGAGAGLHARNAYEKLKGEAAPASASAMFDLWHADVLRRLEPLEA